MPAEARTSTHFCGDDLKSAVQVNLYNQSTMSAGKHPHAYGVLHGVMDVLVQVN